MVEVVLHFVGGQSWAKTPGDATKHDGNLSSNTIVGKLVGSLSRDFDGFAKIIMFHTSQVGATRDFV